ncbi:MAG: hypothetical protein IJV54_01860 [Bacteroidales bacterium]|nr:hypothetical protein [Bacteroidales bacterium]MBQ9711021.1 hypothetical protein [Bacteroidales bacterium]MBR1434395.1 hypothetical protein [Bacteroidales bacterium]
MKKRILYITTAVLATALSSVLLIRSSQTAEAKVDCQIYFENAWYTCDESNSEVCGAMYYDGELKICTGNKKATGTIIQ